jgi:hypothetical protein
MKYTKEQAIKYKNKTIKGIDKKIEIIPDVRTVNGFFIIQSKMNFKKKYKKHLLLNTKTN